MKYIFLTLVIQLFTLQKPAMANPNFDLESDPERITHCYHWIKEDLENKGFLSFKIDYAEKNNGDLTFYTHENTSTGALAGPGLYCAKTIVMSAGYGDRVIRIDFVDDVKIQNTTERYKQSCRINGENRDLSECKDITVEYYDAASDYYIIKDSSAIKSWTASSPALLKQLKDFNTSFYHLYEARFANTISIIQREISVGKDKTFFIKK